MYQSTDWRFTNIYHKARYTLATKSTVSATKLNVSATKTMTNFYPPPLYLLSPKSPNFTVERIGNKAERIRQQWSLLPVLATVDFQQSRPCWIQRCRQCVAGLRLTKVTVLMQCYCHCWTEVKLLCCVVLCRKCCVKHCKDCCATVEGRCGDVAMSTINRTLARTPRTLTYVYIYVYVYINIKYRYIGLMICNDVISDVTHTHVSQSFSCITWTYLSSVL